MAEKKCTPFRKGLLMLQVHQVQQVKKELMDALGIKSRQWFKQYADGIVELTVSKAVKVEQVFNKYGVSDPWGLTVEE